MDDTTRILVGSCLDRLKELNDASIDSIVTDPPYELGFMGKHWDATGIAYNVELWRECLRVLKPGGHLLAFGGTRTYHRMAVAIEDAGFEVRDSIHWVYGSGFPKSLDVSKAIDKAAGAEREVTGSKKTNVGIQGGNFTAGSKTASVAITAPATDAAKQWQGWGTALKPAHEPIIVARKPLDGTVAANVLAHGTGALNIDGARVGTDGSRTNSRKTDSDKYGAMGPLETVVREGVGRWPANIVFTHDARCDGECVDGCPVAELDAQSGVSKSAWVPRGDKPKAPDANVYGKYDKRIDSGHNDAGGASRFFTVTEWDLTADAPFRYVAKPAKKERNAGLDGLPKQQGGGMAGTVDKSLKTGSGNERDGTAQNFHPTVKPVALMRWLVTLVTPPGGIVLDPFLGSGTTAVAAILEGFEWRGCEMTEEYLPIIEGRTAWATAEKKKAKPKRAARKPKPEQPKLL